MEIIEGFHGTDREAGQNIIDTQIPYQSRGDDEWLGDGFYLFRDCYWSFWWDVLKARREKLRFSKNSYFIKAFVILNCISEIDENRIFNLSIVEHYNEFNIIRDFISKKLSELGEKKEISEGLIINYCFMKLGYEKKYDLVMANFNIPSHLGQTNKRLKYESQIIICIKKVDIIAEIEEYDYSNKIDRFREILYFNNPSLLKSVFEDFNKMDYTINRRNIYMIKDESNE